jgi:MAternally-affected-uncoordination protein
MDKAHKYTDKAIAQIEKLRATYDSRPHLLSSFHVLLVEHIIQCRLVTGNKGGAIKEVGVFCRLLQTTPYFNSETPGTASHNAGIV